MENLNDYVEWIANSMHVQLSEEKISKITTKLLESEKYSEMLEELEKVILENAK